MRYLHEFLKKDLLKKMVFVSGPRQCGKTTMAKQLLDESGNGIYLNWDNSKHKQQILQSNWSKEEKLIVLDEIHKYSRWKNFLKGIYDTQKSDHQFLITGSALLNIYKKGQDSMLGRYHHWRLHPFCLAENPLKLSPTKTMERLLERGGFPEPLLAEALNDSKRWSKEHMDLLIKEDLRELTLIRDLSLLSLFYQSLQDRVGSTVAVANIARDLEIAPKTAKQWLSVLESVYLVFSVLPYSVKLSRALLKQPKIYLLNNAEVTNGEGARFENLVATHLLKRLHYLEDSSGERFELRYIRDKEAREVDFVILKDRKPVCLIETKLNDDQPSKHLYYFGEKLKVDKRIQLVAKIDKPKSFRDKKIEVYPAAEWLSQGLDKILF